MVTSSQHRGYIFLPRWRGGGVQVMGTNMGAPDSMGGVVGRGQCSISHICTPSSAENEELILSSRTQITLRYPGGGGAF